MQKTQSKTSHIIYRMIVLFLMYSLIIIYAGFSMSLFSSVSVLFMIISIVINIVEPRKIVNNIINKQPKQFKIQIYQADKLLWITYVCLNFLFLIMKIAMYFTNSFKYSSQQLQQFFQCQSLLHVFLPIILLPFAISCILIKYDSHTLIQYQKSINIYAPLGLYWIFGILMLLIQIFSVSIAGLVYFLIIIYMFWMKTFNLQDFQFKILLSTVQVLTILMIFSSTFVANSYIQTEQTLKMFQFFGIDSIINFLIAYQSRGHIICEVMLFMLCTYLNRLFIYQKYHYIYKQSLKQQQKIKKQSQPIDNALKHIKLQKSHSVTLQLKYKQKNKDKQYQMENMSQRYSFTHQIKLIQQNKNQIKQKAKIKQQQMLLDVLKQQIQQEGVQIVEEKKKKRKVFQMTKTYAKKIKFIFTKIIIQLYHFLTSPEFSLRFIQVISVIIIQRYNNIYSLTSLIWLAIVSNIQNLKFITLITAFGMLPLESINYIITYFYNIPHSPAQNIENGRIFGFQKSQNIWIDVIIFNVYFNFIILFVRSYQQLKNANHAKLNKQKDNKSPALWKLILAFIFRYTYMLTLIAMFFLGFSTPNIMNLFYVALFLVFFSNGDNIIISKRKKNNKQVLYLDTFSKKYWNLIIYYTLICIVLKYIYFLFFDGQFIQQLQPLGINLQYNWSFNFSLSSVCQSNTTPLFIIFLLSQIQVVIYRSYIYNSISFTIIDNIRQTNTKNKTKQKIKSIFLYCFTIINQFYYQTIFYIAGIIIIACSYRWSFIGLAIIILTTLCLFTTFNKKIVGSILFLNLAFLFSNYLIILITNPNYQIIEQFLTKSVIDKIIQISYFIGLSLQTSSYASLFILNIIIFYFCVVSYGLANNLSVAEITHQNERNHILDESSVRQSLVSNVTKSSKSIINYQFQDQNFAKKYKKGVIQQIQKYYNQNLVLKYNWLRKVGHFFTITFTFAVTLYVIIQCLYFRLSISMFLFLITYMIFYYSLFDKMGQLYEKQGYYNTVTQQLNTFTTKQIIIEDRSQFNNLVEDKQIIINRQSQIIKMSKKAMNLKIQFKKLIWKYSAGLSASCLILTYSSQFFVSQFYTIYLPNSNTILLQRILFILGVNSSSNFGSDAYFYFVMLIINVIQKLILIFVNKISNLQQSSVSELKQTISQLQRLQDPCYLINSHVQQNFIIKIEELNKLNINNKKQISIIQNIQYKKGHYEQANLLIYFQFKHNLMKINILYGSLSFIIRFYLWMMLLNVYEKTNVFAFLYLAAVLIFWFRPLKFNFIKNINKLAIFLLCFQYAVLLMDINPNTSPLPLPGSQDNNLSLLQYLINNELWINFITVSDSTSSSNFFLLSFLINSIIIFLTQICYFLYNAISRQMMEFILQVYLKYQNILQKLQMIKEQDPIYINFNMYRHLPQRLLNFFYQNLIMNSYLIVSLLIFILLSNVHNYLAIALLCISFTYIFIGIFSKWSQSVQIFEKTAIYFRIFNIIQFLIIIVSNILQMPILQDSQIFTRISKQFGALTSLQQIILMLFIQLWLDLKISEQFVNLSSAYRQKMIKRQVLFLRCLAFQHNNKLVQSLIKQYKQVFNFDSSVGQAMRIIKNWHASMNKQMKTIQYDFEESFQDKNILMIKEQIQKQKLNDDHRTFSDIMTNFIKSNTDIPLSKNYYQILQFITHNINGVVYHEDIQLDCWYFITEDYQFILQMLKKYDQIMNEIIYEIGQADQQQQMRQTLFRLKNDLLDGRQNKQLKINIKSPSKLIIDTSQSSNSNQMQNQIIPFLLTNIQTLIIFLAQIYYCINPCLLSFPLIFFIFTYFIMAQKKRIYILVLYIFMIIVIGELVQMKFIGSNIIATNTLVKFFFYTDQQNQKISFGLGYLYFLFVIIFISQQILRYKGNRYRMQQSIQNMQQSFIRLFMNQEDKSNLNLWKYSSCQQQFIQKINPYVITISEIENNIQNLNGSNSAFFNVFHDRKIGIDLYPPIAAVQIFLTLYLIFFYPFMTDIKGYTLQQSTKYYQFSSDMVIGVLVHVGNIVIQRYITLLPYNRQKKLIIKYIYTLIIFFLFSWFIYYLAPYKSSLTLAASFYQPSPALIAFSFFYFIYFYLSALQIKYGYRQFKSFNTLMTRRGYSNYYAVSAYTAIPFLYQIKIIMDWTFSATSLPLYAWFRQFSIYMCAFKSKIQYYNATTVTVLGSTIFRPYKIMGWAGFIIILLIIFGPMILFSGLNPLAQTNLVVSGSMTISLQVKNGNSFLLYETSHFSTPPLIFNQSLFNNLGFNNVSLLQQMSASDISQQFQSVTYQPFSDANWAITSPNYQYIVSILQQSIQSLINFNQSKYSFQLVANYQLNRQVTQTIATNSQFYYPSQETYLNLTVLQGLYNTLTTCNQSLLLPDFYISLIRLNTIGNTYKPRPINYNNNSGTPYLYNITMQLFCQPGQVNVGSTNQVYWGVYLQNITQGIQLYVYCDKYQNVIGGYGFTALYTSIILVVAGFVRSMFDGNLPLVPFQMNPKPDNILQICQAINILRVRKQFRQQYLMYYELIDIIRSPEIMKYMSGSYPYLIQKEHLRVKQQEQQKQIQKQKKL